MKKFFNYIFILLLSNSFVFAQETVLKGKELFGDLKARQIGPAIMSGRISDLALHPTNNQVVLMGSAGGGVWKSSDGGASFVSIFDKHIQSIGTVSFDPKDPDNVLWVGTGETWTRNSVSVGDGIYKSTDGGLNWINMGLPKSERISSIIIDPRNSDNIWVGVLGALWGDSDERGIYNSKDGGKTWNKVYFIDNKTGCSDLVIDPQNPDTMYASFWEFRRTAWSFNSGGNTSALFKTIDGGKTWNKIHNGYPTGQLGRIAIAIAPSNPSILYSVIECEKDAEKGLYKSENAGKTWKHLNNDFGLVVRPFYFSRIVVDPKNPDLVYKAGLSGSISRDGGKTFKSLGNMHSDIHDIVIDPIDSSRIYVGTDGGVYRSANNGSTLTIVENLPLSQFYHITLDNEEPYNIYGGLQDNGSWYGPSKSDGGIEARDWERVGFGDGFRVLKHPTKKIIYSEMQGAENIWRYNVETKELKTIQPLQEKGVAKLRFNWNAPIATSLHNPDRIFAGSQFVHVSDDMGASWKIISPDLTTNDKKKLDQENSGGLSKDNSGAENHCTLFTITESPLDKNIIWAGADDGNVQITQDGGNTWKNVTANISGLPKNTWCYHIETSNFSKATAYAVFDGHTNNDGNTYVYKTKDFGTTWTSIVTSDIDGFARCIQEDYENENLLFLGTEKGLYITIDGGKNWSKFENEMPAVSVMHLDLQKQTNDLVMATHGRGVIILDDISVLRQINDEVIAKDVHFFKTKSFIKPENSSFGSTASELEFVGPNPSTSAQIVYYLKKRNTFGKLEIEIQNLKGEKIVSLPVSNKKGINIVTWDFNEKGPKVAAGKTLDYSGFTTPLAPAGIYKAVLTKGKEQYVHEFEVKNDPKSPITENSRQEQRKATITLFNKVQELAYMVYQIDELLAINDNLSAKNPSNKKSGDKFNAQLNELKNTMVITTGDNYVGSAEKQLREKLGAIYASVASQFDEPSPSQNANIESVMELYNTAEMQFKKLEKSIFSKILENNRKENSEYKFKTFEEFVKE
uniref:WD40/YVTN/BNR-like repeat-containing protein n=1 Tax=Flavobacterium sp. TaxID=239 RepID=UPI004049FF1C